VPSFRRDPFSGPLKRVERALRRRFNRTFYADRTPVVVTRPSEAPALPTAPRILFLRQDRIGDVLVSTPILHAVRRALPLATVDMLLSDNNVAVQHAVTDVTDNILRFSKGVRGTLTSTRRLRRARYDVVVDLLDNASTTSSLLVRATAAPLAFGIDKENRGVYSHVVPRRDQGRHHISERLRALVTLFGIDEDAIDMRPVYPISETDTREARAALFGPEPPAFPVGVNYSGSSVLRTYPAQHLITVIRAAAARYPAVTWFVFGAPHHADEVRHIADATGAVAVPPLASYHAFAGALSTMRALVTPDTSVVHLAAAWDMPCCVLFNQPDPGLHPWLPYATHCEAVINAGRDLSVVPPEQVIEAVDRLLQFAAQTPRGQPVPSP
jgi:ADP-heptose:LPS heptosyltransferase